MKLLRFLLPLLLLPSFSQAAAPTFGQVMWTNNTALVILSPERETNRIQLTTNLVTFGGVSSAFPALWRQGTIIHARLADNSAFSTFNAGLIESRTAGIIMDTEDSATPFAYSLLLRKKGDVGGTNNAIAIDTELGNVTWQGWDGAAYVPVASIIPKTEQAFSGAAAGAHMQFRLVASNSVSGTEIMRLVFASGVGGGSTNGMLLLNGTSDSFPALKRFGRQMQVRSADNTGFADFVASNTFLAGPLQITGNLAVIRNIAYVWPSAHVNGFLTNDGAGNLGYLTASALGASPWLTSNTVIAPVSVSFPGLRQGIVSGSESWNPTNVGFGSIGLGSNNTAGGYFSSVLGGASNSIATNSVFSAIVGGELNTINQSAGGHNFIGGGRSNIVTALSSNSVIVGGVANFIAGSVKEGFVGGGFSNQVGNGLAVIVGGFGNSAGGNACFVGGGQQNVAGITVNADWVTIGGGIKNQTVEDFSTIAGGATNLGQNGSIYGFIGGGRGNEISGLESAIMGGVANNVALNSQQSFIVAGISNILPNPTPLSSVMGNFGTNTVAKSILLSPAGPHGSNVLHVTATESTNTGRLAVGGMLHLLSNTIYTDEHFNGGTANTNLSFSGTVLKNMTNGITGDRVYALTNASGGNTMVVFIRGETATATDRLIKFTNANNSASTAILWRSPTNGLYDFEAKSNVTYTIFFTVVTNATGTATNILAQWNTDSQQPIKGAALAISAGFGTSNAWSGGAVFRDATTQTTNHTGTANFTNLFVFTVPANTTTNNVDELEFSLAGHFRFNTATTNGFRVIYGTSTLFDTGFLTISNCPWNVEVKITRTGNSAQRAECKLFAQAPAAGSFGNAALFTYATNMPLAQVNGVTNIFVLQGESRLAAAITNDYREVRWKAGIR